VSLGLTTYIHREFTTHPNQLRRISLDLADPTDMRFQRIHRSMSKTVDSFQIMSEHVRMLVIFGRDVPLDRVAKGNIVRSPERQCQDVAGWGSEKFMLFQM